MPQIAWRHFQLCGDYNGAPIELPLTQWVSRYVVIAHPL